MNFQDLKKVEKPDIYLDVAFSRAKKRTDILRQTLKIKNRIAKKKRLELEKLAMIRQNLTESYDKIVRNFPSFDDLPEFYKELIRTTLDYERLKKSLSGINSAKTVTNEIYKIYNFKIKKTKDIKKIGEYKKAFFGRISSIPKRIKKDFEYLESARKIMRKYPAVKTELKTIAIAGFPNVGKSTLLKRFTSSNPEINSYPFTTKGLNVGYMDGIYEKTQFIDTPGTLNRFEKMNYIERMAYLAIKYLADKIIYVFDPTEMYPFKDQEKLLKSLRSFDKEIWIFISKTDIADKNNILKIKDRYKTKDIDNLKKVISQLIINC